MQRKLVLINPVNAARTGLTINKDSRFPPLSLGILATLTPDHWDITIIDENWEPFIYQDADLVGITAFTAAANRAYEIAVIYRQQGVPVVMGGIHASMCPDEALRYVSAVVIGEAERIWPKVIADFEAGKLEKCYQGTIPNLNRLPHPRRDLFHPDYSFASVQTSRGCPMDCDFCSVTAFNGRRYRRRPVEDVLDELKTIPQKTIFFIDDNIIGYSKLGQEEALRLFKGMVERKMDKMWFCQASLNFADNEEVLHWASRAGCKMVFLGLETEEADSLAEINKQLNLNRGVDAYAGAFDRIHRAGIAVLGAFIFGMDSDTPEKLHCRAKYMVRSGIDVMQVTYLTPLPGTRLFDQFHKEKRLLYTDFPNDWDHYDMTEVVHYPQRMTAESLDASVNAANKMIYAQPMLVKKALKTLWSTRNPIATMFAWNSNCVYRDVSQNNN